MRNITFFCCIFACLTSITQATTLQCDIPSSIKYSIDNKALNKQTELHLYRTERAVAHHYPATQITEAWELNAANMIKPTRFFDAHARAIEYQPNESVHGKIEKDFSYRYQLISERVLQKAHVEKTVSEGCQLAQVLHVKTKNREFEVEYLPNIKTVVSFVMKDLNGNILERWKLTEKSSDRTIAVSFFDVRYAYQSDDFADIGDAHHDPFLNSMVNLGFIEAGASGFYQAHKDGSVESLGTHQHHH